MFQTESIPVRSRTPFKNYDAYWSGALIKIFLTTGGAYWRWALIRENTVSKNNFLGGGGFPLGISHKEVPLVCYCAINPSKYEKASV